MIVYISRCKGWRSFLVVDNVILGEKVMNKFEFLLNKCEELKLLSDSLYEVDELTADSFEEMAGAVKFHIECLDDYSLINLATTIATLKAVDYLYKSGVLKIKKGIGNNQTYKDCVKCWGSFFEVDNYPVD
jgi:hypothetical protein